MYRCGVIVQVWCVVQVWCDCTGAISPAPVLSDVELKRQQHIRELINTEEKFVKDLDVVIEVCRLLLPLLDYIAR